MGKEVFLFVGIITAIFSTISIMLQIKRKSYIEALLTSLYTLGFAGFIIGFYTDGRLVSIIALSVIVPVTIAQAILSHRQYKKNKESKVEEPR